MNWNLSLRPIAFALLVSHAILLAFSATRHSPTHLEPALLAAGISHWKSGRFELYRVNPPLVRMIAALPVMAIGGKTDWTRFNDRPGSRSEFDVGEDYLTVNGPEVITHFFYARWICIPFSVTGAYFAFRWASELYGSHAGLLTLALYAFDPNMLAHGELITADAASTSLGIIAAYSFWKWLGAPTWLRATIAGVALGLCQLAKMSWLILFGLWPALWLFYLWRAPRDVPTGGAGLNLLQPVSDDLATRKANPPAWQLCLIALVALYLMNVAYGFDGSMVPLKDYTFVSRSLSGKPMVGETGNRFETSWFGRIPVPLPRQFVLGFDAQKRDFEDFPMESYLRGEWKQGGWWYYYLYGALVKIPVGTLLLSAILVLFRLWRRPGPAPFRDEAILVVPAICLFLLVSSQTEFSIHFRYALPAVGLGLIWLGQVALIARNSAWNLKGVLGGLAIWSIVSGLGVYPHHLAYFNEFAGGPLNGHRHLLGSSYDWGQDVLYLRNWLIANQPSDPSGEAGIQLSHPSVAKVLGIHLAESRDSGWSIYSTSCWLQHHRTPETPPLDRQVTTTILQDRHRGPEASRPPLRPLK